jgi:hypothetical protein
MPAVSAPAPRACAQVLRTAGASKRANPDRSEVRGLGLCREASRQAGSASWAPKPLLHWLGPQGRLQHSPSVPSRSPNPHPTRPTFYPHPPQVYLMMRTLRDMNMSKYVAEDVPLFTSLIDDLFPGLKAERTSFPEVSAALEKVALEKGLQLHPSWLNKCIQLYETYLVRHGIMLVRGAVLGACAAGAHRRGWAAGRLGGWAAGRLGGWAAGRLGGWADGRMGRWADGPMGGWADGRMGGWAMGLPARRPGETRRPPPPPPRMPQVGPSGSGKSAIMECLAGALTEMGTKHVIWRMNPKAITAPQMFGRMDPTTGDWTDGVFAVLWRRYARRWEAAEYPGVPAHQQRGLAQPGPAQPSPPTARACVRS